MIARPTNRGRLLAAAAVATGFLAACDDACEQGLDEAKHALARVETEARQAGSELSSASAATSAELARLANEGQVGTPRDEEARRKYASLQVEGAALGVFKARLRTLRWALAAGHWEDTPAAKLDREQRAPLEAPELTRAIEEFGAAVDQLHRNCGGVSAQRRRADRRSARAW